MLSLQAPRAAQTSQDTEPPLGCATTSHVNSSHTSNLSTGTSPISPAAFATTTPTATNSSLSPTRRQPRDELSAPSSHSPPLAPEDECSLQPLDATTDDNTVSSLPLVLSPANADVFLHTESYASLSATQPERLTSAASAQDSQERLTDVWNAFGFQPSHKLVAFSTAKPEAQGVELITPPFDVNRTDEPEPEDPDSPAIGLLLRSGTAQSAQLALAVASSSALPSPPSRHCQLIDAYGYLMLWFCLNVTITLYIKVIFSQLNFPYPMLMTATHMLFTFLGVSACQVAGAFMPKEISARALKSLFLFSIIFTMNILLSNASLLAVSINLHQVTRSLVPLCTMFITYVFWNERHPRSVLAPVLVVILGVSLTVWGEMHFSWLELAIVLVGCFFASLKGVLTQKTQMGSLGLSSLDLLRWLCPVAVAQLLSLSYALGEFEAVWERGTITPRLVIHMTLLGIVAFFINYTSFRCAARHAPLTLNIIGNVKQVVTCALSLYVVGGVWTVPLTFGIFTTAVGAYWYALVMARHPKTRVNDAEQARTSQTNHVATGTATTPLESQSALFPTPYVHHPQLRLPSLDLERAGSEIENASKQQR